MTNDLRLDGCRPTPLASYLKALGILRLVAEQADPDVKGWWRAERFWLRTKLTREELTAFFLNDYAPSPIIAPWNGGSGFYPKDNQSGISAIEEGTATRFAVIKASILFGRDFVNSIGITERPTDEAKISMISAIRAKADDGLVEWIDAAVAVTKEKLGFPPLLGTGGNDGRLDFTNNYFQRVCELFEQSTGASKLPDELFLSALFDSTTQGVSDSAIGQFSPAVAGGANSTSGFEGGASLNPWDYVLMIEGAVLIAGGVVRRFASEDRSAASFPFTVRATGSGFGTASQADETVARGEFWAPLWSAQSNVGEVRALFREGRIAQTRRSLRDGMDAALAIASVGADRRIAEFQRYGFQQRQGLAYLATPLERRVVARVPKAELATDLDHGRWLENVRRAARGEHAPAHFIADVRSLEDSLFALANGGDSGRATQAVIIAVGRIARVIASSSKLRESLNPPPLLRRNWISACGDDAEVRLASALAGLRLALRPKQDGETADAKRPADELYFRAHIAPLAKTKRGNRLEWTKDGSSGDMVWTEGRLDDSLVALALRRSIEAIRTGTCGGAFSGSGRRLARLSDVAAFLAGSVNDDRIGDLALGFSWIGSAYEKHVENPQTLRPSDAACEPLPLVYAALKPIFAPPPKKNDAAHPPLKFLPTIAPLLASGRLDDAVKAAMRRAQADGLPTPFKGLQPVGIEPRRLLASLLFPISESNLQFCMNRAYPADDKERANENAA